MSSELGISASTTPQEEQMISEGGPVFSSSPISRHVEEGPIDPSFLQLPRVRIGDSQLFYPPQEAEEYLYAMRDMTYEGGRISSRLGKTTLQIDREKQISYDILSLTLRNDPELLALADRMSHSPVDSSRIQNELRAIVSTALVAGKKFPGKASISGKALEMHLAHVLESEVGIEPFPDSQNSSGFRLRTNGGIFGTELLVDVPGSKKGRTNTLREYDGMFRYQVGDEHVPVVIEVKSGINPRETSGVYQSMLPRRINSRLLPLSEQFAGQVSYMIFSIKDAFEEENALPYIFERRGGIVRMFPITNKELSDLSEEVLDEFR